eukprot:2514786-Alexandrium_andersonii.AAC.1
MSSPPARMNSRPSDVIFHVLPWTSAKQSIVADPGPGESKIARWALLTDSASRGTCRSSAVR